MPKTVRWFVEIWDDILVYLVTLLGVLVSQYLPVFKTGQAFDISTKVGPLIIGAVIALSFVLKDEEIPQGADKTAARHGKRVNLRRRLSAGLSQGMMWATLTSSIG